MCRDSFWVHFCWGYEFFENIDDYNFVEEFDKIVEDCTEVAANEIDKVQAKGIYNDAGMLMIQWLQK